MISIYAVTYYAHRVTFAGLTVAYNTDLIYGENLTGVDAKRCGLAYCQEKFPPEEGYSDHQCNLCKIPGVLVLGEGEKKTQYRVVVTEIETPVLTRERRITDESTLQGSFTPSR